MAERRPQPRDPPGVVRVSLQWIDFDRLLRSAFDQIRLYSKADSAVSLRLLRALGDIATTTSDPRLHRSLLELGKRIVTGCAEALGEEELREMRVRLAALESLTGIPA